MINATREQSPLHCPPARRPGKLRVMVIYLIRHGETPLNATRVVQFNHTPLSERGREQAQRVGVRMRSLGIGALLTSDFLRARMTAEAISEHTAMPLVECPSLRERAMGELEGRPHADHGWNFHDPDFDPPGGEGPSTFASRVSAAWGEVVGAAAACDGDLAVVTHGLVLHALACQVLVMPAGNERPSWGNTSVTVVAAGGPPWTARVAACTAHLDGDGAISGVA